MLYLSLEEKLKTKIQNFLQIHEQSEQRDQTSQTSNIILVDQLYPKENSNLKGNL